ncbi:Hypothetical predicted protein [Mytilus galloprovincialis]|uniref:C1q domain-containing protein n=1 Tax=Mytilus galloprovincialis TaxID=29158 RepID=A0A8B6DBD8_MYTGA|nr:Hypothetical predicted protein [Mytilus galloprovincialis]
MKMMMYIFLCLFNIVLPCQITITGNSNISCCNKLEETALKPAFSAFLKNQINPFSRSDILKFDDVRINLGGHYNPKTGKFTAPKSGLYHISYNLMGYEKSTVTFQINKNNGAFVYGYADGSGYATSPSSVLMELEKGDLVYIIHRTKRSEKVIGQLEPSFFCGYFLQPVV